MLKLVGYVLFVYSWIAWAAIAAVPFLGLSLGMAAAFVTFLLVSGEIAFYLSLVILGKEFWSKIKSYFAKALNRNKGEHTNE